MTLRARRPSDSDGLPCTLDLEFLLYRGHFREKSARIVAISDSASSALAGQKLNTVTMPRVVPSFEIDSFRLGLSAALKLLGQDVIDNDHPDNQGFPPRSPSHLWGPRQTKFNCGIRDAS